MGELASTDGGVGPFSSQLGLAWQVQPDLPLPVLAYSGRSSRVWRRPTAMPGMRGSVPNSVVKYVGAGG